MRELRIGESSVYMYIDMNDTSGLTFLHPSIPYKCVITSRNDGRERKLSKLMHGSMYMQSWVCDLVISGLGRILVEGEYTYHLISCQNSEVMIVWQLYT